MALAGVLCLGWALVIDVREKGLRREFVGYLLAAPTLFWAMRDSLRALKTRRKNFPDRPKAR